MVEIGVRDDSIAWDSLASPLAFAALLPLDDLNKPIFTDFMSSKCKMQQDRGKALLPIQSTIRDLAI